MFVLRDAFKMDSGLRRNDGSRWNGIGVSHRFLAPEPFLRPFCTATDTFVIPIAG
jgi:hypothetical protein